MTDKGGIQYSNIAEIKGPLVVVDDVDNAAFDELVEIETIEGERRLGKVLEVGNGKAIVQVFEGTTGLSISGTSAKFVGKVMEMPVSKDVLGRVFDGLGRPKDGLPDPIADKFIDINGEPMNPEQREYPKDFIQTGVSVIDGLSHSCKRTKTSNLFRFWYVSQSFGSTNCKTSISSWYQ